VEDLFLGYMWCDPQQEAEGADFMSLTLCIIFFSLRHVIKGRGQGMRCCRIHEE